MLNEYCAMAEFLPICDVLFNVISLAGYFCDVVFDVVMGYALLDRGYIRCFSAVVVLVGGSLILSQLISLRWYLQSSVSHKLSSEIPVKQNRHCVVLCAIVILHCLQLGVLWRYAKLFIPVDLRRVKHEVRDLCMLRIQHGFCQAAPMLLLQLYLMSERTFAQTDLKNQPIQDEAFSEMNTVATLLSLFSVCWALASFSKNVRLQNVHRLVLTWLGVIFQFLWRLGTISSRVTALTAYATLYAHWVFLVIGLHWVSMFLWLISPRNVFHGEQITKPKKCIIAALISFVYVFAYVNLQELNHRRKMITFYIVMFLENLLLLSVWIVGIWPDRPKEWYLIPLLVIGSFVIGVCFMLLYYRFFHVRRLGYEAGGRPPSVEGIHCFNPSDCGDLCKCSRNAKAHRIIHEQETNNEQQPTHTVPGVFNCRFSNPVGNGTKRKKKKPTTFIPPPSAMSRVSPGMIGPEPVPFWRKPLPTSHTSQGGSSENEGSSVGSRVNIYQKLQEKKLKQLAELKIIEEEIRQGKLGGPINKSIRSEDNSSPLPRQPIPISKKHNDIQPIVWAPPSPELEKGFENLGNLSNHVRLNYQGQDMSNYDLLNSNILYNGGMYMHDVNEFKRSHQQDDGNASPVSQISATESNSLTQKTLPHIHAPHELNYSYSENADSYGGGSPKLNQRPSEINYGDVIFQRDIIRCQDGQKSPLSVQSHSPKLTEFPPRSCERRRVNLSYDGNVYDAYPQQNKDPYNTNMNNSFPYNVVPPPKTKLERSGLNRNKKQRSQTPEILLSPHYLDNNTSFQQDPNHRLLFNNSGLITLNENDHMAQHNSKPEYNESRHSRNYNIDDDYEIENAQSDIDSQISLPRSYTLPREFKYCKRNRGRKTRTEHVLMSTNSSDGDVDSGDDIETSERAAHIFNNTKLQNITKQRKTNGHFAPILKHHHDNISGYSRDQMYAMCPEYSNKENYGEDHSPSNIGRTISLQVDNETANFNMNGSSSPSNVLDTRPIRSRHCGNRPRHETKL